MDKIKAMLGLENCRIKFTTGEGDYEGTIARIAPEIQLLVLTKLVWLPKNLKLGTLTFRAKEIENFSVIDRYETKKTDASLNYTNLYERDFLRPNIFDDEFDTTSVNESEFYSELETDDKDYFYDLPPSLSDVLPLDNIVVDKLDNDFHDAIQHFLKQDVIGLSLESPKIGRHEKIHWLNISTVNCTFLFDIEALGESAFKNGLQEILEDSKIEKVIHDCRVISDCLYHCYGTKLSNVFDTQVADFIIKQQDKKDDKITHYVHSLNHCLAHYINIPQEFLISHKRRSYQDDLIFYGLRPLTEDLRDLFTKNVIYLRRLKQELDLLLLEPLNKCNNIYIKSVRNKTNRELQLEDDASSMLPNELLSEGIQIFRFKKHLDIPTVVFSGPPYTHYRDPFTECFKIRNIEDADFGKNS